MGADMGNLDRCAKCGGAVIYGDGWQHNCGGSNGRLVRGESVIIPEGKFRGRHVRVSVEDDGTITVLADDRLTVRHEAGKNRVRISIA